MQTWVGVFIVIAAIAVVVQTVVVIALFFLFRQMSLAILKVSTTVETRLSPVLERLRIMLEESRDDVRDIVRDTAEVARTVRENSRRFDRLVEDATDRLRSQMVHADRLITGALETIEDAAGELRRSFLEPVRTATAFVRGVKAGVGFFRGRSRTAERRREAEDEGLFV
jgi:methyl-accepting chemotaxis protein